MYKTPYEIHKEKKHNDTSYSPNGIDKIIECQTCGIKWLFTPSHSQAVPITIYPDNRIIK